MRTYVLSIDVAGAIDKITTEPLDMPLSHQKLSLNNQRYAHGGRYILDNIVDTCMHEEALDT